MTAQPDFQWLEGQIARERAEQIQLRLAGRHEEADIQGDLIDKMLDVHLDAQRVVASP